jgi:16S rRNA (cytosine967-C5)-methyltransferase
MRLPGRLGAAIEVLDDIEARKRPASEALKDWGVSHRFAGAGDRAAIGNLVFDALRKRLSHAAQMGEDTPRAVLLCVLARDWGLDADAVAAACDPEFHGPAPLSEIERVCLTRADSEIAMADHVRADVPEWLWPHFTRAFGAGAVAEGQALAQRAPVDLRVNTLKTTREKALKALEALGAVETPHAQTGLRIPASVGAARNPHVEADAAFLKGWVEVQDEASQIAVALAGVTPGMQVADVCAGGGGKTLALAAAMDNKGQVHAYDRDKHRLAPIYERVKRAGARNVQIHGPGAGLDELAGKMDLVFVDAPCTGTGVWRRKPDAKWRLRPSALEQRAKDQAEALELGAKLVKPGGRLVYATCSVLAEENEDAVGAFLGKGEGWTASELVLSGLGHHGGPFSAFVNTGLLMSPWRSNTDGFFASVLIKH